jgi:NUMOD3 motif
VNVFYVYKYLRARDSKNGAAGSPYYVGKGKGKRMFDKNHRCKPPSDVANIVVVSHSMSEWDAHQLEMLLIYVYGRIDKGTGCLANLTDGGEGQMGRSAWNKGLKGIHLNPATEFKKGVRVAPATEFKKGNAAHRVPHSPEARAKMSESTKGQPAWNKKYFTEEERIEGARVADKQWRLDNRERIRASMAEWRLKNQEALKAYKKKYNAEHPRPKGSRSKKSMILSAGWKILSSPPPLRQPQPLQ